jgi:glycosyltransferase involved in cell wall biosynthesis
VAEALGCGKPVLGSTQGNIIREIIAGGAGFADEDTREGCTRLLELWKDSDMKERKTMGMHAMACFSDHFGVGTAAAKFRAVISNPEFNDHLP